MKSLYLTLIILLLFTACKPSTRNSKAQVEQQWADSLTAELSKVYEMDHINGYGVAIVNEKGFVYQGGLGYADIENKIQYTENSLQNIASVSKTLIGVSLLKAQELGHLNLDDPINSHLPFEVLNPTYPNSVITLRHLATHTSSILDTDYYDKSYVLKEPRDSLLAAIPGSEDFNPPESMLPIGEFLQKYLSTEGAWYLEEGFLDKEPGTRFEYSNVGATLAAYIIEVAAGQPFDAFTTEHILKPLGMKHSGWSFDAVDFTQHTKLYSDPQTELPFYSLITYPDGGLITSISDMGLFLTELIKGYSGTGTLLSQESYQELFGEQLTEDHFEERDTERAYDDEYNSGIFMGHTPNGHIGHTGGDPGVSTFMFFNPETKTGRLLFINTGIDREGAEQFLATWDLLEKYASN